MPAALKATFSEEGSALERYAARLPATEINSSFYRPHRRSTYERWAASVPDAFRFAVKVPKLVTHVHGLVDIEAPLARFLDEVAGLEDKLGVLLVQLPPKLAFDARVATAFFQRLREARAVCEPRHASWFTERADTLLRDLRVARVAADPAPVPAAARPGGFLGLEYHRLHGSPRRYWSSYEPAYLEALASRFASADVETWCIFDNTAAGAALDNALALQRLVSPASVR
ncbi:MAG: DUF72 domain-containing protein [Polyangia bacterium]